MSSTSRLTNNTISSTINSIIEAEAGIMRGDTTMADIRIAIRTGTMKADIMTITAAGIRKMAGT